MTVTQLVLLVVLIALVLIALTLALTDTRSGRQSSRSRGGRGPSHHGGARRERSIDLTSVPEQSAPTWESGRLASGRMPAFVDPSADHPRRTHREPERTRVVPNRESTPKDPGLPRLVARQRPVERTRDISPGGRPAAIDRSVSTVSRPGVIDPSEDEYWMTSGRMSAAPQSDDDLTASSERQQETAVSAPGIVFDRTPPEEQTDFPAKDASPAPEELEHSAPAAEVTDPTMDLQDDLAEEQDPEWTELDEESPDSERLPGPGEQAGPVVAVADEHTVEDEHTDAEVGTDEFTPDDDIAPVETESATDEDEIAPDDAIIPADEVPAETYQPTPRPTWSALDAALRPRARQRTRV